MSWFHQPWCFLLAWQLPLVSVNGLGTHLIQSYIMLYQHIWCPLYFCLSIQSIIRKPHCHKRNLKPDIFSYILVAPCSAPGLSYQLVCLKVQTLQYMLKYVKLILPSSPGNHLWVALAFDLYSFYVVKCKTWACSHHAFHTFKLIFSQEVITSIIFPTKN